MTIPPWAAGVLLAALLVCVYSDSFSRELAFDSSVIIRLDPRLRALTLENLAAILREGYWWPSGPSDLYRPLTTLTYLVNYTVLGGGTDPFGYQLVNLVLHGLVTAQVFLLGRRLALGDAVALGGAALFAVHPVLTEGVVNVVGRADEIVAATLLGALLLALDARHRGWTPGRWGAFALLALGGVFAKENAVVVVPVVIAVGCLALNTSGEAGSAPRRANRNWWLGATPGFVLATLGFAGGRWWFSALRPFVPLVDNPIVGASWFRGRLTALRVLLDGVLSFLAPVSLSADYSYAQIPVATGGMSNSSDLRGWLALAALVLGGAWLAWRWWRGGSPAVFLVSAAFIAALPTSNLLVPIGSIRAERFLYVPGVFVAPAIAVGLACSWSRLRAISRASLVRRVAVAVAVAWFLALVLLARARTYDWRDDETLWEAALSATPGSYKVHANVGALLVRISTSVAQDEQAVAELEEAKRILEPLPLRDRAVHPYVSLGGAYGNLADRVARSGQIARARELRAKADETFRLAVEIHREAQQKLVDTLRARGVAPEDMPEPAPDPARSFYAVFLLARGRPDEALALLQPSLELRPVDTDVRVLVARAEAARGHWNEALHHAMYVILLGGADAEAVRVADRALQAVAPGAGPGASADTGEHRLLMNLEDPRVAGVLRDVVAELRADLYRTGAVGRARELERFAREKLELRLDAPAPAGEGAPAPPR